MTQPSMLVHQRGTAMLRSALGPAIGGLLIDPQVAEVMLNADGKVWVDRLSDGMADTGERLTPLQAERVIRLVAHHVGTEVHAGSPRVSAELPGTGERFEGLLPPVVTAPVFSIRRPASLPLTLEDYVAAGVMTERHAACLVQAVRDRANILVAGGTSTGKTTLTNALLGIAATTGDRIILIEEPRRHRGEQHRAGLPVAGTHGRSAAPPHPAGRIRTDPRRAASGARDPRARAARAGCAAPLAAWTGRRQQRAERFRLAGQALIGMLLGAVWSPCVGPTLGAATVLAAQGQDLGEVAVTMAAFGLGVASVLLLLATATRAALARRCARLLNAGGSGKRVLGWPAIKCWPARTCDRRDHDWCDTHRSTGTDPWSGR